jgi:hypothetical protein
MGCSGSADRQAGDTTSSAERAGPEPSGTDAPTVRVVEVNHGSSGMAARVRWALSEDRSALIVMEDPAGVENEPFPNGFVLARETSGGVQAVQQDSVWDAAPSPDWSAVAFGRAHRVSAGERDSLTTGQWDSLARAAGLPVADARRGAFPASGMAIIVGLAQPGLIRLPHGEPRVWPVTAGWRMAWSRDGGRIAAAMAPAPQVSDDAEPHQWVAIDTADGTPRGALPSDFQRFEAAWTEGPVLDISMRPDITQLVRLAIEGGTVESIGNRITRNGVEVGPGVALAATRRGRAIVALAPDPQAREYEPKERLVVYLVEP